MSSRLGPALQVGEDLVWRETVAAAGDSRIENSPKERREGTQGKRKPVAAAAQC